MQAATPDNQLDALNKLCDPRDFDSPALATVARSIMPERDPVAEIERKVWEFAMFGLAMESAGLLRDDASALGIGAGNERILYWLAQRVGTVVATDVYGEGDFADKEAPADMLSEPEKYAPYDYPRERLEVRKMDARQLDFEDESFDFVFCISSIEHFGFPAGVSDAAREMGRVVRPGGFVFIATDCFVRRHPLDAAPVDLLRRLATGGRKYRAAGLRRRAGVGEVFTLGELDRLIVAPSGLALTGAIDTRLSSDAYTSVTRVDDDATLHPSTGKHFPHVLLQRKRSLFTSVSLLLRKK